MISFFIYYIIIFYFILLYHIIKYGFKWIGFLMESPEGAEWGVCVYTSSSPSSTIANIPNVYGCCRVAWSSEPSSAIAVGWLLAVWPIIAEKCVGSSLPLCTLHQLWKSAQCCRKPPCIAHQGWLGSWSWCPWIQVNCLRTVSVH